MLQKNLQWLNNKKVWDLCNNTVFPPVAMMSLTR